MTLGLELYNRIMSELEKQNIKRKDAAIKCGKSLASFNMDLKRMKDLNQSTLNTVQKFASVVNKRVIFTMEDIEKKDKTE